MGRLIYSQPQNQSQKERFYVRYCTLTLSSYRPMCRTTPSTTADPLFWKHPVLTPGTLEGRRRTRGCSSTVDPGLRVPLTHPTVICFRNKGIPGCPSGVFSSSPVDFCHLPRSPGFTTRLSSRRTVPGYNTTRTQIEETD